MASIAYKDEKDGPRTVLISGRLDAAGVAAIDGRFGACCAVADRLVVLNLCLVTFLASQGIRCLLVHAKAAMSRGSQIVLLVADNSGAEAAIRAAGIDHIIPTFSCPEALRQQLAA